MAAPIKENLTILKDAGGAELVVPEQSSGPRITMTLLDETGAAVPLAAIQTATLTIYARDEPSQPIINSVTQVDIKNVGRGTIHATSGLLTIEPVALDNSLANAATELEWHRLLIEVGYSSTKRLKYEVDYPVRNLNKVS